MKNFFLIAGPCVIESEQLQTDTAGTLKEITDSLGIPFIFKSSFDKANRTSESAFRGLGIEIGLEILAKVAPPGSFFKLFQGFQSCYNSILHNA